MKTIILLFSITCILFPFTLTRYQTNGYDIINLDNDFIYKQKIEIKKPTKIDIINGMSYGWKMPKVNIVFLRVETYTYSALTKTLGLIHDGYAELKGRMKITDLYKNAWDIKEGENYCVYSFQYGDESIIFVSRYLYKEFDREN